MSPVSLRSVRAPVLCAALLAIAAAGCAHKVDDAAIVTNIKAQMFSDAQLKDANLQVSSAKGVVTLSGNVTSDAARLDAYKIAAEAAGVTKVNDQMTVEAPQLAQAAPAEQPEPSAPTTPAASAEPEHRHGPRANKHRNESSQPNVEEAPPGQPAPAPEPPPSIQDAAPASVALPTPAPASAPPPPPKQVVVPADTTITVRMIDSVDSAVNKAGEVFHASLDAPLLVDNDTVVPAGADVFVRLAEASSAGHIKGQSQLRLELVKLEFQGQSYPLTSGTYSLAGASRGKDTAKKVGAGAVIGGLIGAIAGGGKGAAIGATVGGGAGGVYQASTNGKQVKVPSETRLNFQLEQPVTITVIPSMTNGGTPQSAEN
jgi:BON domain